MLVFNPLGIPHMLAPRPACAGTSGHESTTPQPNLLNHGLLRETSSEVPQPRSLQPNEVGWAAPGGAEGDSEGSVYKVCILCYTNPEITTVTWREAKLMQPPSSGCKEHFPEDPTPKRCEQEACKELLCLLCPLHVAPSLDCLSGKRAELAKINHPPVTPPLPLKQAPPSSTLPAGQQIQWAGF